MSKKVLPQEGLAILIKDNATLVLGIQKPAGVSNTKFQKDLKALGLEVTKDAALYEVSIAGRGKIAEVLKSYGVMNLTIMGRRYIMNGTATVKKTVAPKAPGLPAAPAKVKAVPINITCLETTTVFGLRTASPIGLHQLNRKLKIFNIQGHQTLAQLDTPDFENLMGILKTLDVTNLKIGDTQYIEDNRIRADHLLARRQVVQRKNTAQQKEDFLKFMNSRETTGVFNAIGRLYSQNSEIIFSMTNEITKRKIDNDFKGMFLSKFYVGLTAKGILRVRGVVCQGLAGADGTFDIDIMYDTSVLNCDENEGAAKAVVHAALGDNMWKCYGAGAPTSFIRRKGVKQGVEDGLTVEQLEQAILDVEDFVVVFRTHKDNQTGLVKYTKRPKRIKTLGQYKVWLNENVPLLNQANGNIHLAFVTQVMDHEHEVVMSRPLGPDYVL